MFSDKTRAERIEEAARAVMETSGKFMSDTQHLNLGQALALPPDPPRGDGWDALMRARKYCADDNRELLRDLGSCGEVYLARSDVLAEIDSLLAAAQKPEPAESPAFDMLAHLRRQREWSERTFGPGSRAAGVVDHIRKELDEIASAPGDIEEWIDVVILALDGAWRSGASPEAIVAQLVAKQTKNEGRSWPDWRTADPNAAIQHVKPAESPAEPAQDDEAVVARWNAISAVLVTHAAGSINAKVAADAVAKGSEIIGRLAREKAERDAMIADLRAKLAAAESDMLKVAQAIGIVYQADYHNDVAGPTSTIVERILAQESRIHDLSEMLAAAEARIAEMGNK